MAMEEPQQLIQMSMGKIASSRGQRGGINLHKNLLVAGVLIKARTAFIMENYHTLAKQRNNSMESREMEDTENNNTVEAPAIEPVHEEPTTAGTEEAPSELDNPQVQASSDYEIDENDKENAPPCSENLDITDSYSKQKVPDCEIDTDIENSNVDTVDSSSQTCNRCTKRRLAEIEDNKPIISSPSKKHKQDSENGQDSENNSDSDEESESEPMHVESVQISNLVHKFNAGFNGLCSLSSENTKEENSSGSTLLSQSSQGQSRSCSTQIKDAFESLARPIIAMTV